MRSAIERALSAFQDETLGFGANPYFSDRGLFARFVWPDWPEDLKKELAGRVDSFHREHRELRPVSEGGQEWQAVFRGWHADPESASVIAKAFCRHFPGRVAWVESERDSRGRIGARCMVKGLIQAPPVPSDSPMSTIIGESVARRAETAWCTLQLSWKDSVAIPPGPLSDSDHEAFQASVREVFEWASGRIKPLLDALHDGLKHLYGERFRGLYVYGSYARADAGIELGESSDIDVALILSGFENAYDEITRFSEITSELSLERGLVISVVPIRESDYKEGSTNFIRVISEYAVPVK
jgi:predicted nucleotidyltransferase